MKKLLTAILAGVLLLGTASAQYSETYSTYNTVKTGTTTRNSGTLYWYQVCTWTTYKTTYYTNGTSTKAFYSSTQTYGPVTLKPFTPGACPAP